MQLLLMLFVVGVAFCAASIAFLESLGAGAREQGLGRECVRVMLIVVGV